ncbi:MAG: PfkB family carbohydrate kinase [bacterium]
MSVLIVGTIAYDTVETPLEKHERILGGSATYASFVASRMTPTRVSAVIGEDFLPEHLAMFERRGIDMRGVEKKAGKCFFWAGRYGEDPNARETLATELNVLAEFSPALPAEYEDTKYLFLANVDPEIQLSVLKQCKNLEFSLCDTMNFWIENKRGALDEVLARADCVLLNDEEARMLCGTPNLVTAARRVLEMGPRAVVVKKGEHGAAMFSRDDFFALPAFPLEKVKDPTGAGDTFAGGLIGSVAREGKSDGAAIRRGMVVGTVAASFCVEDFSVGGLESLDEAAIMQRIDFLKKSSEIKPFGMEK